MKESAKKVRLLEPIDAEKISIVRDYYFPSAYIIDLPLESAPDHIWQHIFEGNWKASHHLWDRKLFVMGDKLRLVTTLDEIEDKLEWVKQVVDRTNKDVDDYNEEVKARQIQTAEVEARLLNEDRARVEAARDMLRKSFKAF